MGKRRFAPRGAAGSGDRWRAGLRLARRTLIVGCAALLMGACTSDPAPRSTPDATTTTGHAKPSSTHRTPGCGRAPDAPRITDDRPGDVARTLQVGSSSRDYRLAIPSSYRPDTPVPLIVNLHGSGSNAFQAGVYSDLPRAAANRNMIVVTPDAVAGKWELSTTGADATFLTSLVDDIESRYCIDPSRVHLIGMSLGAWKAAATACSSGDGYASIALVAVEVPPGSCPPIPVVAFHGTADPVVAYGPGGGTVDAASTPNRALPGTRANIARWAEMEGCGATPTTRRIGDDVELRTYAHCTGAGAVELYTITGGGHTWPGSSISIGDPALTTHTIDATAIALDWFAAHPRRN